MTRLDNISIKDLLNEIGLYLSDRDVQIALGNNLEAVKRYEELKKEKSNEAKNSLQLQMSKSMAVVDVFREYESIVNREYLVLLTLYNLQERLEVLGNDMDKEDKKLIRGYIQKAISLIGNRDFNIIDLNFTENADYIDCLKVTNSQELIRCIKQKRPIDSIYKPNKKQEERIKEIDESIGFDNLIQLITVNDFKNVVASTPEIGESIFSQVSWNAVEKFRRKRRKDLSEYASLDKEKLTKELETAVLESAEYREAMSEAIIKNCKYVDIDQLLILVAYRIVSEVKQEGGEALRVTRVTNEGKENEEETMEETMRILEDLLKGIYVRIKKGTILKVKENSLGEEEEFSKDKLEEEITRFQNGRYIAEEEVEETKKKLLSKELTLADIDGIVFSLIHFEEGDALKLIENSEENVKFLLDRNAIQKNEIGGILQLLGKCSNSLFVKIQEKRMLKYEEMIALFKMGILSPENLSIVYDEEIRKRIIEFAKTGVRELYTKISSTSKEQKPEDLEMFNKYRTLYKHLIILGKTDEEIRESGNELISSFEENLNNDILTGLYQYGLITLESAADWGIDLNDMLSQNTIRPTDLKELYKKQVITIDSIKTVLMNGNLDYEEKLDLIYSTFDGESEEEYKIREELVDIIGIGDEYRETRRTGRTRIKEKSIEQKQYITDPHARWKLISLLDSEYSKKFLPQGNEVTDGHRVFFLPNREKVVIEKMHEKKKGKKVSAYGSATYVMEAEEFFRNIGEIIIDGSINRTALRELAEEEKATKIVHSKFWGNAIKRYFEIGEENGRYTKEEIEAINTAIKNVENSRRERN